MNPVIVHYLNIFLGIGAIALIAFSVITFLVIVLTPRGRRSAYLEFLDDHFLILGFLLALSSSIFPLIYSEIVGFLPCVLCWWQRVFMFPTMFLFGVALWYKDRQVVRYAMPLLSIGFLISLYQNFFSYFGDSSSLPCDASGVSCFQALIPEFGGYIQIPTMALSAFAASLALLAVARFYRDR